METETSLPCTQEPATGSYPFQMNPVHNLTSYSCKIHINIILPSMTRSPKWYFHLSLCLYYVLHACYILCR
jgi:hypothetical protein